MAPGKGDVNIVIELIDNVSKQLSKIKKSMSKTLFSINKEGKFAFQGWAMSIMFAGMAIKRTMMGIWQASSKTFNDVMHSTEGSVTGFDKLQSSLIYLQFVAGQALEPLAELLIPIIDGIAELIQDHPDAFKWVTAGGLVLGSLMATGGGLALALNGMAEFATKIGLASTNANGLLSMDWSKFNSALSKGIGTVGIGWALVQVPEAFDSFKEKKWVDGLIKSASIGLMAAGGIRMMSGAKYGGALMALGIAFELINMDQFFSVATNWFGALVALAAGAGAAIGRILVNTFKPGASMMDGVGDAFKLYFNRVYGNWSSITASMDQSLADLKSKAQAPTLSVSNAPQFLDTYATKNPVNISTLNVNISGTSDPSKFWSNLQKELDKNKVG